MVFTDTWKLKDFVAAHVRTYTATSGVDGDGKYSRKNRNKWSLYV